MLMSQRAVHGAYTQYHIYATGAISCIVHLEFTVPDTIFHCRLTLVACQFTSWQFIKLKFVTQSRVKLRLQNVLVRAKQLN